MFPRVTSSPIAILGIALVLAGAPALAASKKGKAKAASTKAPAKGSGTANAGAATPGGACSGAAILSGLRTEMAGASRRGEPSDLAGAMMMGVIEGAFTTLLHSMYALGAAGQAMHKGGMPTEDTAVVARDIGKNLGMLATTWSGLASQKALAGPPAQLFRELARVAGSGVDAAKKLESFAKHPNANTQASAFSDALERWRADVADLAKALRGPQSDEKGEQAPPPPLPAP
ncbi:MAG: hypothetical protein H6747_11245 [Deltaproteobacteria bacterium]|nr:hypothetical protein [Deltaproteobacteria bacterium]